MFLTLRQFRFRWLVLQLQELRDCSSKADVKAQLASLPRGLDETYDKTFLRINEGRREDAKRILQYLAFSASEVEVEEVSEIVTIDLNSEDGPVYKEERQYRDQKDVLDKCKSLVTESNGDISRARMLTIYSKN